MPSIGLRHLEHFVAVADGGSLSQAARVLGVSQPTVSEALAVIEDHFGARLFRRHASGVELTTEGRALYGPAVQVLRSYGEMLCALDPHQRLETGQLSISCPPMLAQDPLVAMIGRFRAMYPHIHVRVYRPRGSALALEAVQAGDAEVAITSQQGDLPGVDLEGLTQQNYVGIVPPEADMPDSGSLEALLALGLVTSMHRSTARRLVEEALGARRVAEAIAIETAHLGSIISLVRNGVGAAVVSEALAYEATSLGVRTFAITPTLASDLFLAYRSGRRSRAADAFLDLGREMAASGALRRVRSRV